MDKNTLVNSINYQIKNKDLEFKYLLMDLNFQGFGKMGKQMDMED